LINIDKLIRYSLSSQAQFNDSYHDLLDKIVDDEILMQSFTQFFVDKNEIIDSTNVAKVTMLLNNVILNREKKLIKLYPVILRLMYEEYSCNPSLAMRFTRLLVAIKEDKQQIFTDILHNTNDKDTKSVSISIFALEYLFADKQVIQQIPKQSFDEFLIKVNRCSENNKDDKKLKAVIEGCLFPLI
jgi:hypothetical protein